MRKGEDERMRGEGKVRRRREERGGGDREGETVNSCPTFREGKVFPAALIEVVGRLPRQSLGKGVLWLREGSGNAAVRVPLPRSILVRQHFIFVEKGERRKEMKKEQYIIK